MILQQGDTILKKIDSIPNEAELLKNECILHYGATGNHHKLSSGAFGIYKSGENKFLDVAEDTNYSHEEHKTIVIPAGKYALTFVQEYDHFNDLARNVVD
jgi:hypothetical protein